MKRTKRAEAKSLGAKPVFNKSRHVLPCSKNETCPFQIVFQLMIQAEVESVDISSGFGRDET